MVVEHREKHGEPPNPHSHTLYTPQINASSRIIPVVFQLPTTARYLVCSKTKIKVQSLRWPVSRQTSTRIATMDGSYIQDFGCVSKGTCLQADAALWVRPMCSVNTIDLSCVESFRAANCFPYCMALHMRGSGTDPMVLHGANEWNDGVSMLRRDCGLFMLTDPSAANATSSTTLPANGSSVQFPGSPYGLNAQVPAGSSCTYNPAATSFVTAPETYAAHSSIELEGQPFAFAGDLALVSQRGVNDQQGNPTWNIQVQRIFGNQANEFTIVPLAQRIPSSGPCTNPSDCGNVDSTCQAASGCLPAIPYGWDAHPYAHIPATVTERWVFYVTNPDMQPFEAFAYYCQMASTGEADTNKFQISVLSSYGGIRLWRMDPYIYCPINPTTGQHLCPAMGSAGSVQIQPLKFDQFETAMCSQKFAVLAVGLDYINEDNLALTVLRTTLANLDTTTLRPIDATLAEYVTIWVNPNTFEFNEEKLFMPDSPTTALIQGQLCPSQRRTPNVGSLMAEMVVSTVLLIRLPINIILGIPVLMDLIDDKCPMLTRDHYLLKTCGAELISLDDYFDAIYRYSSTTCPSVSPKSQRMYVSIMEAMRG